MSAALNGLSVCVLFCGAREVEDVFPQPPPPQDPGLVVGLLLPVKSCPAKVNGLHKTTSEPQGYEIIRAKA